jgi:thiol-disulfide isomerase/thioredoxin
MANPLNSKIGDSKLDGSSFLHMKKSPISNFESPIRIGMVLLLLLVAGCSRPIPNQTMWSGTVELAQGAIHLPFKMFLDLRSAKPSGYFLIGEEKAPIPEIIRQGNSLTFQFSEYGAQMTGTWNGKALTGNYVRRRNSNTTTLKFSVSPDASAGANRKAASDAASPAGKYRVHFEDENIRQSATVATLWEMDDAIYGTFIAPDGDYGLLTGNSDGKTIQLGRFTGWQAMAMTLSRNGESWSGNYYSQNDKPHAFTLEPVPSLDVTLPAPLQTAMKNPDSGFTFQGVSEEGETMLSSDDRFRGQPLVVDIMGTWCHNCIDESPLLQELQTQYGDKGLQVVGISFEITDDQDLAKKNLKLYRDRLGLTYTTLFCGSLDDDNVATRLRSQIDNFFAYPTTLFIGRDGKVKAIHSGFKGPGTGPEFQAQTREFHELVRNLVN